MDKGGLNIYKKQRERERNNIKQNVQVNKERRYLKIQIREKRERGLKVDWKYYKGRERERKKEKEYLGVTNDKILMRVRVMTKGDENSGFQVKKIYRQVQDFFRKKKDTIKSVTKKKVLR